LLFSQRSLQDYADCPRRFQLRYLLGVAWPAVRAEPIEEMELCIRLGQRFHRMVHQYILGIPAERLEVGLDDEELHRWWHNFLAAPPRDLPTGIRRAEVSLSASLADHRLTARYDLLAADPGGRLVIVDWKTGSRPKNTSRHLLDKLQTIVYPYVLVKAGAALNGGLPVQPEQVTMVYWFADSADDPLTLAYDAARHAAGHDCLVALVGEIVAHGNKNVEIWPLTDSERACKFCTYRSLCNRGNTAGDLDDLDDDLDIKEIPDIYLEQVAEIAFQ
jgi:CRISPR/Cas system-associated exonuclease Cas4 (RecB family)